MTDTEMLQLGTRLGRVLRAGDTVALTGGLGLVQTYELNSFTLWHCDLYRLDHPNEAYELGLMDAMGEDVCLLEWPDRLGPLLPEDVLKVEITFDGDGRVVMLTGWDGRDV